MGSLDARAAACPPPPGRVPSKDLMLRPDGNAGGTLDEMRRRHLAVAVAIALPVDALQLQRFGQRGPDDLLDDASVGALVDGAGDGRHELQEVLQGPVGRGLSAVASGRRYRGREVFGRVEVGRDVSSEVRWGDFGQLVDGTTLELLPGGDGSVFWLARFHEVLPLPCGPALLVLRTGSGAKKRLLILHLRRNK